MIKTSSFRQFKEIANTGALCCVAAGPHEAKSPANGGGDSSNNREEPHWRTNSSFSPPPLRTWDCRLHSEALSHEPREVHNSSLSTNSRGSRRWVGHGHLSNHHHSVSDGALSFSDSPPYNVQEQRWTSPLPKFNLGELSAPIVGGSKSQTSWFPSSAERGFAGRASAASPTFGSCSPFSESSPWESSTGKRPFAFTNHNLSNRRSHLSKAVYPLMFRNPVSDYGSFGDSDISGTSRLSPVEDQAALNWPDNSKSIESKFHKTLSELQKPEVSPDPSASSRRDGFRWSSASSYDTGIDLTDHMEVESLSSPVGPETDQKCGVCGKFLWRKSPWSSHRIMRGNDMPTTGVLPCSHVFHAECLEQATPTTSLHDPPCPLCLKTLGNVTESSSISQPLQMALRSIPRSKGVVISETHKTSNCTNDMLKRNRTKSLPCKNHTGSSIANRLRRHFSVRGKISKDIFPT